MRRRGRSLTPVNQSTNAEDHNDCSNYNQEGVGEQATFIDEDDQEKLVLSLQVDAIRQAEQFRRFFAVVCVFAILVTIAYPLLCRTYCSSQPRLCWIHSAYSSILHGVIIALQYYVPLRGPQLGKITMEANTESSSRSAILLTAILITLPLLLGVLKNDAEDFHLGLIIGNMVTFVGMLLLRWDAASTRRALEELHASKYKYKDL